MAYDVLSVKPNQMAEDHDVIDARGAAGAHPGASGRGKSKGDRVEAHRAMLGQVPDSEVAKVAGVCVRTVATYRQRLGIPGYAGPRRPPPKRNGKRSMLDSLAALIGVVPDRVVAEQAGMSIGAVQAFRVARGIDAAGSRTAGAMRASVGAWQTEPGKPPGPTLAAWQVSIDDGSQGIVVAADARAAMELACGADRSVVAIQFLGELMAAPR
jgi:hypothetical protein